MSSKAPHIGDEDQPAPGATGATGPVINPQAILVPQAEAPHIDTPLIGASLKQVWKPLNGVGVNSDATAPFALGTVVGAEQGKVAQFCRITANVAIGGTAGITAGLSVTAGAGNTYTNQTGQALVIGDYAFLTAGVGTTP